MSRGTLRGQLTFVYTVALVVGLIAFAALSLIVLDRTARTSLDQRLLSEARALTAGIEVHDGQIVIDTNDQNQVTNVVGVNLSGAVYSASGRQLMSTALPVPAQIRSLVKAQNGTERIETSGRGDAKLRVASVPIFDGQRFAGTAMLWRSMDSIDELDRRSALVFAFAIPIIVAFAIFFGTIVAKRGLAPLRRLADLASDIEAHDLSRRLAIASERDELGRLCAAFDRMLDRLEAAFGRERRFTGDASHELRGPLSVIRAEAELAMRRPRAASEYQRTLQTILQEAENLEHLTSDLLAAARAEGNAKASRHAIDFGAVVSNVCRRLAVLAQARGVSIEVPGGETVAVLGDESELTRLVFAIVHNAVKYSLPQTTVSVRLALERPNVRLTVSDGGNGFSEDALIHAFDRFWRDDEMRAREGSGLGLSIAQRIVQSMRGSIRISNGVTGGVVEVLLPVSPAHLT